MRILVSTALLATLLLPVHADQALPNGGVLRNSPLNQLLALQAGAVCDALIARVPTDDTTAIQAALDAASIGDVVHLPRARQCYVTKLTIPPGVTLDLNGAIPDNAGGSNYAVTTATVPGLVLERSGTVTLSAGSGLRNGLILAAQQRTKMSLPAATAVGWSGDCITAAAPTGRVGTQDYRASDGYRVENVLCIGQARALVSQAGSRLSINKLWFDVNPGGGNAAVTVSGSGDTTILRGIHGWPFATSALTGHGLRRTGTGILLSGQNDDTHLDDALFINFDIGADFQGTGNVDVGSLWTDTAVIIPGTRGVRFGPNTSQVLIKTLWSFHAEIGIVSEASPGNHNLVSQGFVTDARASAISISGGNFSFGRILTRSLKDNVPALTVAAGSFVNGLLIDENTTAGAPVIVAPRTTTDQFAGLRVVSPYRAPGTPTFAGSPMTSPVVSAADPLRLPTSGEGFTVSGRPTFGSIAGGYHDRRIRLRFTGAGHVFPGNILLAGNPASRVVSPNTLMELRYDADLGKWVETFFRP